MNIVLFLGAGFSAAYGYPTMNQFLSVADSSTRITQEQKDFIGRLVLDARSANSFLQSSPTNLEDILSFSVMEDRLKGTNQEKDSQNYKIKQILQRIFTNATEIQNFWTKFSNFKSFLSFDLDSSDKHDLSIITTNYDLCIECAISYQGYQSYPGFVYRYFDSSDNLRVYNHLYSETGIPVFKLHGSVNWYQNDTDQKSFTVEDRVVGVMGNFNDRNQNSLPYICTNKYEAPDAPVIVPPSFLKPELRGPLDEIWKGAAEKLAKANIVIFVGYSFPLSDTDMMYFFARSFTNNAGLRKIILIDPSANEIAAKLNSVESKYGSHFKALLSINNNVWEKTSLKKYL